MKKYGFKRFICVSVIISTILFTLTIGIFAYFLRFSPEATPLNTDLLLKADAGFTLLDISDEPLPEPVPIRNVQKASLKNLNDYTKNAFIAVEDKRFYEHDGIDLYRIVGAIKNNIISGRVKEGASTITQQLIKNTHLTGDKNASRKINEIRLARELEKRFSKDEILEMYVNTIYFGNNAYGIENAAKTYFGISASELSVSQSALLAGLVKAPTSYAPNNDLNKSTKRRNLVLKLMFEQGFISEKEYEKARHDVIDVTLIDKDKNYRKRYMHGAIQEACELLNITEKQLVGSRVKIYTYYRPEAQTVLENSIFSCGVKTAGGNSAQCSGIIADNNSRGITAFCGTGRYNLYTMRRNIGSTAKPLAVYAPAIEEGIITPATPVNDEFTDFGDYAPRNYADKYYGWISMRSAVAKSLNCPAVKTLNALTPAKAREYLTKNGFSLHENDSNLSMALGAFTNGVTLKELVGGYVTLAAQGEYSPLRFIRKIETEKGDILYEHKAVCKRVFSKETAFLMTDMLKSVVTDGTAKKLKSYFDIAAKTGTSGLQSSKNNTDAIVVSYTVKDTVAVWCGGYDDDPLPSDITGGGAPAETAKKIYDLLYKSPPPDFQKPEGIVRVYVDSEEFEKRHVVFRAEEGNKNAFAEYFSAKNLPEKKQTAVPEIFKDFTVVLNDKGYPIIKASVQNPVDLYRIDSSGKEVFITSFLPEKINYTDKSAKRNSLCSYYLIDPKSKEKSQVISIKVSPSPVDSDWWKWIYKLFE